MENRLLNINSLVSADIGFGTCTLIRGDGYTVTYRSIAIECDKELSNFEDKTGSYLVGDDAVKICCTHRKSTDTRFFSSSTFRILLMYGMKLLGVKYPILAIGLPNEFYSEMENPFKQSIKKFSEYFTPADKFQKVIVLRQPQGTVWCNSLYGLNGVKVQTLNSRIVVVDGGDGTTDISEFFKGRMVPNSSFGVSEGASQIHKKMLSHYKSKFDIDSDTNVHDMDLALRKNFIILGNKKHNPKASQGYIDGVENYTEEISSLISGKWSGFNKIDYVILSGGIVSVIGKERLTKKLSIPRLKVLIPKTPSQANAEGYLEFMLAYFRSKGMIEKEDVCELIISE